MCHCIKLAVKNDSQHDGPHKIDTEHYDAHQNDTT
jgi:hypothetical protein